MNFKMVFTAKLGPSSSITYLFIKFTSNCGILLKNLFEKIFLYISLTFKHWPYLHLQFLKEWYILSWQFQQQSCSARWALSFDIHIGGGPGGVFNFTVSNSGEGGIKKRTSDSDSGAPTILGTIEKGQKLVYE